MNCSRVATVLLAISVTTTGLGEPASAQDSAHVGRVDAASIDQESALRISQARLEAILAMVEGVTTEEEFLGWRWSLEDSYYGVLSFVGLSLVETSHEFKLGRMVEPSDDLDEDIVANATGLDEDWQQSLRLHTQFDFRMPVQRDWRPGFDMRPTVVCVLRFEAGVLEARSCE